MTQLELSTPLTRFSDPSSSHEAAASHIESGRRDEHSAVVLANLVSLPGYTYRELAARLPHLEPVEVMRRLNDLAHSGLVDRGIQRTCTVSGRRALTWWPREEE